MNYIAARDIVEVYLNDKSKKEIIDAFLNNVNKKRIVEIAVNIVNESVISHSCNNKSCVNSKHLEMKR